MKKVTKVLFIMVLGIVNLQAMQIDQPTDQQLLNNPELKKIFYTELATSKCSPAKINYDIWAAKLAYYYDLSEKSSGGDENLIASIILDLKKNSTNPWVKYEAIYEYIVSGLPALIQDKGFHGYRIFEKNRQIGLNAQIALTIDELLKPVLNQDINIGAKAKAAVYIGVMRASFAKNKDYSLANKYLNLALEQKCDFVASTQAKLILREIETGTFNPNPKRAGEALEERSSKKIRENKDISKDISMED